MPSNDKPLLKDLEWLLDSKLKPIHTRNEFDERFKCLISSLFKKRINFAFHQSLLIFFNINFLFCSVYLLLHQVYDIHVYQCVCCASFMTFSHFQLLLMITLVTQLVQLFSYLGCSTTVCIVYFLLYLLCILPHVVVCLQQ